jgi:hypothetical protein
MPSTLASSQQQPAYRSKRALPQGATSTEKDFHPVYSDYSHLASQRHTDIGGLAFVAGLRAPAAHSVDIVAKILPMTKIIPVETKARQYRLLDVDVMDDVALCMKEECIARRNIYNELNEANRNLRNELSLLRDKLMQSNISINNELNEIQQAEARNDGLMKEIDAVRARYSILSSQSAEINQQNETLRTQLRLLQQDFEKAKAKTDDAQDRLNNALDSKTGPSVVFRDSLQPQTKEIEAIVSEVSQLTFGEDGFDSDEES